MRFGKRMPCDARAVVAPVARPDPAPTTRNQLDAVDDAGRPHAILVESTRHVTRTWRGVVVQTGGDRFFLAATREPLVLDPDTATLRTQDGRRRFTFRIG